MRKNKLFWTGNGHIERKRTALGGQRTVARRRENHKRAKRFKGTKRTERVARRSTASWVFPRRGATIEVFSSTASRNENGEGSKGQVRFKKRGRNRHHLLLPINTWGRDARGRRTL